MERRINSWFSPRLGMDMPVVAYGHAGYPLLMLPTAAADFLEYERFHLVDSIRPLVEAGRLRAYSVNSVNRYSLLNDAATPPLKAELLTRFNGYLTEEVLPFIRNDTGDGGARPLVMGVSLGASLAANAYFRRPDLYGGLLAIAGSYDLRNYYNGYHDDNVYFNNPVSYLPNLNDDHFLGILRSAPAIYIVTGQGRWEAPERSRDLSNILRAKGIPHKLEMWGYDVDHDWPWWRKMLPYYLDKILA